MSGQRPNDAKLKELILYIAQRCKDDPYFGKTKLNKILFYSDFTAYAELGEAITGQEYMRLPHGPGPRRLKPVLDKMARSAEAALKREPKGSFEQERVVAQRLPDISGFTEPQLAIVNRVIRALWNRTNSRVSEISHADAGWQLAENGETIPYETVFLSNRPLTEAEIEYGRKLAAELGL